MDPSLYEAHERLESTHWWFVGRRRIIREVLQRRLPPHPGRRILDVGCGSGGMFPLLADFGSVEGVEASSDALERAARRFPSVPVHPGGLPHGLPEGSWDLVTLFDVLEHVEPSIDALRAVRRRLAPGGQLVVTVPALELLWSEHDELNRHYRRYTLGGLTGELEAAGFSVAWASYFNSLLFPLVLAARLAQRVLPAGRHAAAGDLAPTPEPLNRVLALGFGAEASLLRHLELPVGVSLVAVTTAACSDR